jgi:hypothetical protein
VSMAARKLAVYWIAIPIGRIWGLMLSWFRGGSPPPPWLQPERVKVKISVHTKNDDKIQGLDLRTLFMGIAF